MRPPSYCTVCYIILLLILLLFKQASQSGVWS